MWIEADVNFCAEQKISELFADGGRELVTGNALRWVNIETGQQIVLKKENVLLPMSRWQVYLLKDFEYILRVEEKGTRFADAESLPVCSHPLKMFDFYDFYSALEYVISIVGKSAATAYTGRPCNLTRVAAYNYHPDKFETVDMPEDIRNNQLKQFADQLFRILHLAGYKDELKHYLNGRNMNKAENNEAEKISLSKNDADFDTDFWKSVRDFWKCRKD